MTKPTKWHVGPAKTQISIGIRPVWSDCMDAKADLSLRWVHVTLLVLSRAGSFINATLLDAYYHILPKYLDITIRLKFKYRIRPNNRTMRLGFSKCKKSTLEKKSAEDLSNDAIAMFSFFLFFFVFFFYLFSL